MSPPADSAPVQPVVTLAEAAEALGVHYMTAYRYVRTGRMLAEKRAGKWWVAPDDLAAVVGEGTGARRRADSRPRELLVEPFTARLIAGDTAGCWDLISAALSGGAAPVEIHTMLLRASLVTVGESWRTGEITVFDEHRATATAWRLIGQMGPLFRHRGRRRGTIVVGMASGDYHGLPSALLADLLSDRHFEVVDLGANTPSESFLEAAQRVDDLVGIGLCAVIDEALPAVLRQVGEIREQMPDAFLLAGGPAIERYNGGRLASVVNVISYTTDDACLAFEGAAAKQGASSTSTTSPTV